MKELMTEDGTGQAPGGPVMPTPAWNEFLTCLSQGHPDLVMAIKDIKENEDGTCTTQTQMRWGLLKADIPAYGPFPEVKFAEAPETAKTTPLIFPFETCVFGFTEDGSKLTKIEFTNELGETADATSMEMGAVGALPIYTNGGVADKMPK